jgi:hypothetical protein
MGLGLLLRGGFQVSSNRYNRPEGTRSTITKSKLRKKPEQITRPRTWANWAEQARRDLERNKRLIG